MHRFGLTTATAKPRPTYVITSAVGVAVGVAVVASGSIVAVAVA